jgi:hypothetical protein
MHIPNDVIELIRIIVWPLILLVFMLVFHGPLATFLTSLGGRVTKISVSVFSLELAQASTSKLDGRFTRKISGG